jgi:predicted CXXCH cytochrome family protein
MIINLLPLYFAFCILIISSSCVFAADSCITSTCHQAIAELKNLHLPVKEGDCLSCHKPKGKEHPNKGGGFELVAKGVELCNQCHDAKGKKKEVHAPVKDGACLSCHRPHGASGRFLIEAGEDQKELCLGCHDSAPFKQKYIHAPVAVGSCTKCHDAHESSDKALLNSPVRNLCLKCHEDFAGTMKDSPVVHPPVKNGPCTSCHQPHATQVASLLKKKMPDLCIECHDAIGKKVASAKFPHKPIQQERGCTNCHSAHFGKAKGLLASDEKSVCLGCHDKDLGKLPIRNIKKEIANKKYLHGPIQKGECKACHDPHGSNFYRMLRGNYPADLYAPYKDGLYDACLQCHEKNLLRYADTTLYTKFRNGNRNLHFVHVANNRKGRTCRMCHEPHASDGPKLISTAGSKFGDWKIPFKLELTETGGRCSSGCHQSLGYDRAKPLRYSKSEPSRFEVISSVSKGEKPK